VSDTVGKMISIKSLAGAALTGSLGVGVLAMAANAIEKNDVPKFSLTANRFDLNTFKGRFCQQLRNCDPSSLVYSDEQIREAESTLKAFKAGESDALAKSDADLWAAQKLAGSAVHPDTGEIIPRPFRMCGYVPYNGPVCVSMMAVQSTPGLIIFNWVNQSQNALVNYFNRNASSPSSNETLFKSYCAAVGAAVLVAFGLSQFIKRRYSPEQASKMMKFVAFPSSIVASCSNCYIMRRPEIESGITVSDQYGSILADGEKSSIAAKKAVEETVMSRAILQIPVFFVPAMIMTIIPGPASLAIPLTTLWTILSFGFGLPAAVAYFPQLGSVSVSELEPSLQEKLKAVGGDTVYYNKGL